MRRGPALASKPFSGEMSFSTRADGISKQHSGRRAVRACRDYACTDGGPVLDLGLEGLPADMQAGIGGDN